MNRRKASIRHSTRSRRCAAAECARHRPLKPGAFTLAELIVCLLLLAIIGGATAAVATAVTRGWQVGEASVTSTLTITRSMLRIQDKMQRAKVMGRWRAGSVSSPASVPGAAVLFWRDDDNRDELMQLDETQLLEYDPATQRLLIWEAAFPDAATRAAHNGPFPTSILHTSTAIDDYKQLTHKKTYAMTTGVLGAAFAVINPATASQRPIFEFRLKFKGSQGETIQYGTATARSPKS